jgi:hypothetical protein
MTSCLRDSALIGRERVCQLVLSLRSRPVRPMHGPDYFSFSPHHSFAPASLTFILETIALIGSTTQQCGYQKELRCRPVPLESFEWLCLYIPRYVHIGHKVQRENRIVRM